MEDIRPTARWAKRVLRPLTSIYHRLEKYREDQSQIAILQRQKELPENSGAQPSRSSKATGDDDNCSDSESGRDDPSWVPGKTDKRRIKNKYTSRGEGHRGRQRSRLVLRSPEVPKTLPGAIEIGTPLITGRLPDMLPRGKPPLYGSTSMSSGEPGDNKSGKTVKQKDLNCPGHKGWWREVLDLSNDPGFIDIAHCLDRVFLKFLENTRVSDSCQREGRGKTRSLLSMAARRLPRFISEEQRLHDESTEDEDVDMCDAYFTELEAFYGLEGSGWPPLREAVRAQGIHLVSEMFRKNWIIYPIVCRLLEECIYRHEYDALETILSNQLLSLESYDHPKTFHTSKPLDPPCSDTFEVLNMYYWWSSGRISYVFDEVAKLLLRGALPPEWMVTVSWKKCMEDAVGSLSRNDGNSAAATRLIEAVILSASGIHPTRSAPGPQTNSNSLRHIGQRDTRSSAVNKGTLLTTQSPCPLPIQDALNNLILSLVTALCGMHIVRSNDTSDSENVASTKIRDIVKGLASIVQREIEVRPLLRKSEISTFQSFRRGCVLLGNYLLQCGNPSLSTTPEQSDAVLTHNLETFFQSLAGQQDMIKELSGLVGQVVRCCERANQRSRSPTSQEVRANLSHFVEKNYVRSLSLFLGKVAVEVAMDFAQSSQDPDDHAWAAEIQEKVATCQRQFELQDNDRKQDRVEHTTGPFRWEDSIGEWVASTPVPKITAFQSKAPPKPQIMVPAQPPSPVQLSSSNVLSSSPTRNYASSVTSASPSGSAKRKLGNYGPPERAEKRARTTYLARPKRPSDHLKVYTDSETSQDDFHELSTSFDGACDFDLPLAATRVRTRRALREVATANQQNVNTRNVEPPRNPGIEVVVVNKKKELGVAGKQVEQLRERARKRGRPRKSEPIKPASPRKVVAPPVAPRRPLVIPCSQDDESDDELSFL